MTALPDPAGKPAKLRSAAFLNASNRAFYAVWALSAAYLLLFVRRGWIPGDEGLLGHMAERVLAGELPHRDFDDLYTGLLDFWHALAFRLLGIKLTSIRWLLFAAALAFVPLVFQIARRIATPATAGAVTLLCVVWTLPNYFASMPSWYNLFLATGGVLALLKHLETDRRRWLVIAGLCASTSILFKSVGLYFVAAALLYFVHREQVAAEEGPSTTRRAFSWFLTLGLASFAATLTALVLARPGIMEVIHFTLPGMSLAAFLIWEEWRLPRRPFALRLRTLASMIGAFFAGLLPPILAFLSLYARAGDLTPLFDGRFFVSPRRIDFGSFPLPETKTLIAVLPLAALWTLPLLTPRLREHRLWLPASLAAATVLAFCNNLFVYQVVWFSVRATVPALVISGLAMLVHSRFRAQISPQQRQSLFLLLAAAALTSIVQFPYSRATYFFFVAPLVALAWLFFFRIQSLAGARLADPRPSPWRLHLCAFGFFFLFALLWSNFGRVQVQGIFFDPRVTNTLLELDRGGLWVEPEKAELYQRLVHEVRQRTPEGAYIFATPDCPQAYFLSGRRNPTRTLMDFLDQDYGTAQRQDRLLALLDEHQVDLVVLHWDFQFSAFSRELAAEVFERFPNRLALYPLFTLHWRERTPAALPDESSASP